ncbi:hypothetical protein L0U85_07090 [Glycomyces sp. L485]|uniref:hypothetical protein n=1 Tax=Glycomyces sp. L485 TaxID=2909235 RepID=UPI001F4A7419|nr:hypothetical protein [Glycomyces sp. L485]MCH7230617.1 hypothetical protein [Glycomyces sp. L485]
MSDRQSLRLWLRVRQVPLVLCLLAALTVTGLAWGYQVVPLPTISGIGGAVGLLWFYPIFASCAITLVLTSPFPEREAVSALKVALHTRMLVIGLVGLAALVVAWMAAVDDGPHSASQLVGGLFYWTALSLISARILGPSQSWVLVMIAILPVTALGLQAMQDRTTAWWVLPMLPGDAKTVGIGALMLSAALVISAVSRHRTRRLLRSRT